MNDFPANPSDGTVFEIQRGVYYVYEAGTKSWIKVAGTGQLFPLATPVSNGVMAAADLKKLNRIMVPMPSSTITGENCNSRFVSGHIDIYPTDDFIKITGKPLIQNAGVGGNYPFRISKNTAGFDFTIDKQALINTLIANGQLNLIGPAGSKGATGEQGDPGTLLQTGPKGPKGDKGKSPSCQITITPDTAQSQVREGTNKAIVGITTERISDSEFNIVVNRGVVGNPDAAPTTVNVRCGDQSTWVLAVPTNNSIPQQVYYIDISSIIIGIQAKFESELDRVKRGHEDIVKFWLEKMSALFYAQKAIICCAITKCEAENAAAAASNPTGSVSTFMGPMSAMGPMIRSINVDDNPPYALVVDGLMNVGSQKQAAEMDLPPGHYVVEIVNCCIKTMDEYVGDVVIIYNGGADTSQFINPGRFTDQLSARRSYEGLTIEIDHTGGVVKSYLPSSLFHETAGAVTVQFTKRRDITAVHDTVPDVLSCTMTLEKLTDYEEAWKSGDCCGFVTRVAGQDYIVMKRSLGGNCGDGESGDCVDKFSSTYGSLAVAWPTFDGINFIKIPEYSVYTVKIDQDMNSLITGNLMGSAYTSAKGTIGGFTTILFPIL